VEKARTEKRGKVVPYSDLITVVEDLKRRVEELERKVQELSDKPIA
jgi:cell division septum initiation protein DivIVA